MRYGRRLYPLFLAAILFLFVNCNSCPEHCACNEGAATTAQGAAAPAAPASKPEAKPSKGLDTLSKDQVIAYGKRVFQTTGSNTCADCHGKTGHQGRLAEAADLRQVKTWKAYKTLKGDLAALEPAIIKLIRVGAGVYNSEHPEPVYDVGMLGVVQGATKSELRKIRKELKKKEGIVISMDEALDFGAEATFAYVKTLWIDADGAAAPAAKPAAPAAPAGDKAAPAAKPGAEAPKGGK